MTHSRRFPGSHLRRYAVLVCGALLASAFAAAPGRAQSLTLARAKEIAATAVAEAKRLSAPGGAIAITDAGGHLLYLERLDGTFPAAATVSAEKARTAAVFQRPTADFEDAIRGGRNALLGVAVMTPLMGGRPIHADGAVVGAIGVSGAASAQQDDEIARAAVTAAETAGGS